MNKIILNSYVDIMRLRNVERSLMTYRNDTLDVKKRAKKEGDDEALAQCAHDLERIASDLVHVHGRLTEAERQYEAESQQMALLRTLMYCAATVADNMAFNLICWLKEKSTDDDGEVAFAQRIRQNCRALGEINAEFGEMGGSTNNSFNICEDILVEEMTKFCEDLYNEMAQQEVTDDKEELRNRLSEKFKVKR